MTKAVSTPRLRCLMGWFGIVAIVVFYTGLYTANYWLPIEHINYTSRIWEWSQTTLTIAAGLVILARWRSLTLPPLLLGFALATLSALSHWQHNPSLSWSAQEGLAVWACFVAGIILFKNQAVSISAFEASRLGIGKSLSLGILFALPLAVVNNLYFYLNADSVQFQNGFASAFEALSPAIHEEIVFRFFVIAVVSSLIQFCVSDRWMTLIAIFLAVVPHSLNHLPELFLDNPAMGLFMLAATSLLFGLPMAFLQVKKNLETAIAFHWFIDFARFWFGF